MTLEEFIANPKNLYAKHPEKVESMRTLLKRYVDGEPCAPNKD